MSPDVHCSARPGTGFVHRDGPCRCFVGGPAPEFAADVEAPRDGQSDPDDPARPARATGRAVGGDAA